MKRIILSVLVLFGASQAAEAQTISGSAAVSLAAGVAQLSPFVAAPSKTLLDAYANGRADAPHPRGLRVRVAASSVTCRAGNVDITAHSCTIRFANGPTVSSGGRSAHELYATLIEAGVQPDGAAGSIYTAVSDLVCTIDADEIAQRTGGGANCSFAAN